jgi:hypothetical protein
VKRANTKDDEKATEIGTVSLRSCLLFLHMSISVSRPHDRLDLVLVGYSDLCHPFAFPDRLGGGSLLINLGKCAR